VRQDSFTEQLCGLFRVHDRRGHVDDLIAAAGNGCAHGLLCIRVGQIHYLLYGISSCWTKD
jgi:hypothetical protein